MQAMKHTVNVAEELRAAVHSLMHPIVFTPQSAPTIPEAIFLKIANMGELIALARTYVERDGHSREASGVPVTEGNTRLPQELCQIARGSALLDGRSEVDDEDYKLVCRVAFDSLPPARTAVLKALIEGNSPHSLGLPKATIDRAMEDLQFAGIISVGPFGAHAELLPGADDLLVGAGVVQRVPSES
jgi:hypothetical protein